MSKVRPPRLPESIKQELANSGYAWKIEAGRRHHKLYIEHMLACVLSYGSASFDQGYNARSENFTKTSIRQAVRKLQEAGTVSSLPKKIKQKDPEHLTKIQKFYTQLPVMGAQPAKQKDERETTMNSPSMQDIWDNKLDDKISAQIEAEKYQEPRTEPVEPKKKHLRESTAIVSFKRLFEHFGSNQQRLAAELGMSGQGVGTILKEGECRIIYEKYADLYFKVAELKKELREARQGRDTVTVQEVVKEVEVEKIVYRDNPNAPQPQAAITSNPMLVGLFQNYEKAKTKGGKALAQWAATAKSIIDMVAMED